MQVVDHSILEYLLVLVSIATIAAVLYFTRKGATAAETQTSKKTDEPSDEPSNDIIPVRIVYGTVTGTAKRTFKRSIFMRSGLTSCLLEQAMRKVSRKTYLR